MRSAARVFRSIGLFGLLASLIFATAARFRLASLQGPFILAVFFIACLFLSILLGQQGRIELDGLTLPGADEHADEEIHLPGPSWYPAAYGVASFVVVLGLVYGKGLLVAGLVALVLTTVGWGVESVHDYRREIAHAHPPASLPSPDAIDLAQRVLAFKREHGGADAVVQHLGRGTGEIVLVGADGAWGNLVVRSATLAREACALGGATLHDTWPAGLGSRVRSGEDVWREMGGESAFAAVTGHQAPRDGSTQVAALVFLGLAVFAFVADLMFTTFSKFRHTNLQGMVILSVLGIAFFYLYLGLRNAKARPEDIAYADADHVTIEPEQPAPPVDLETLHLPGPSWWPAFFSIAGAMVVLGLVFNRGLLVAGVVALVLCCVGWGVESVHEYRQQISH